MHACTWMSILKNGPQIVDLLFSFCFKTWSCFQVQICCCIIFLSEIENRSKCLLCMQTWIAFAVRHIMHWQVKACHISLFWLNKMLSADVCCTSLRTVCSFYIYCKIYFKHSVHNMTSNFVFCRWRGYVYKITRSIKTPWHSCQCSLPWGIKNLHEQRKILYILTCWLNLF
jgi:hypothetical protein